MKAKKEAALAMEDEVEEDNTSGDLLAAAEAMESIAVKEEVVEDISEEKSGEESTTSDEDNAEKTSAEPEQPEESEASLMKLKKDELVEKAKAAGVPTSGTKADIVARLLE